MNYTESDLETIAIILLAITVSVALLPLTIITLTALYLMKHIRTNKMLLLWFMIIAFATYNSIYPKAMQTLITEIFYNTKNLISDFTPANIIKFILIDNFTHNIGSYANMILLGTIIAIIIYEIYLYRKKLQNAGVTTFIGDVDTISGKKTSKGVKKTMDEKESTLIGTDNNNNPVYIKDNAKHIFICGTTGSGKTVAISNFIQNAITKNYPMLIIDGKGDLGDGSILQITKKLSERQGKKLYIVNMTDPKQSDKYNPFKETQVTVCKDMLVNLTNWSEEHYKQNTERFMQRLFVLMEMSGVPLTLKNILKNLNIDAFDMLSARLYKAEKLTKEEHAYNTDISKASGKIAEEASARFSTIVESDIGTIFEDGGIDVYTALKQNATILFVLNPLLYSEVSTLFGKLVLVDATKAVSKLFGNNDKRTFFIFDEINTYASNTLVNLINKSRTAKVTAIAATQSLADLEAVSGEAFREQIIENCNNYIVLRQNGSKGAETWAKIIGTVPSMEITHQLGNNDSQDTIATGRGSAKIVREFIYHPDEIKSQKTGKAIYVSKDEDTHTKINIKKVL